MPMQFTCVLQQGAHTDLAATMSLGYETQQQNMLGHADTRGSDPALHLLSTALAHVTLFLTAAGLSLVYCLLARMFLPHTRPKRQIPAAHRAALAL